MTIVVYGPQGCGKTTNAGAIARAYGLASIADDWAPGKPLPANALALTHVPGAPGAIAFEDAMRRVRASGTSAS